MRTSIVLSATALGDCLAAKGRRAGYFLAMYLEEAKLGLIVETMSAL